MILRFCSSLRCSRMRRRRSSICSCSSVRERFLARRMMMVLPRYRARECLFLVRSIRCRKVLEGIGVADYKFSDCVKQPLCKMREGAPHNIHNVLEVARDDELIKEILAVFKKGKIFLGMLNAIPDTFFTIASAFAETMEKSAKHRSTAATGGEEAEGEDRSSPKVIRESLEQMPLGNDNGDHAFCPNILDILCAVTVPPRIIGIFKVSKSNNV